MLVVDARRALEDLRARPRGRGEEGSEGWQGVRRRACPMLRGRATAPCIPRASVQPARGCTRALRATRTARHLLAARPPSGTAAVAPCGTGILHAATLGWHRDAAPPCTAAWRRRGPPSRSRARRCPATVRGTRPLWARAPHRPSPARHRGPSHADEARQGAQSCATLPCTHPHPRTLRSASGRGRVARRQGAHLHDSLCAGDLEALARALGAIVERQLDDLGERRVLRARKASGATHATRFSGALERGRPRQPRGAARRSASRRGARGGLRVARASKPRVCSAAARTRTFSRITSGPFTADTVR